jgi:O-antigen/teichoic acid export membrane protein
MSDPLLESEPTDNSAGALRLRGVWGLIDQAVVSGGNFLTNIVLANAMASAGEYGRFTLLWGILLLLNSIHGGFVSYPISVRGGAGGAGLVRRLAVGGVTSTLIFSPITVISSIAAAFALGRLEVAPWMAFAGIAWQIQETTRRSLLASFRVRGAVIGDSISYFGQAAGVIVLAGFGIEHLSHVFMLMAGTSLTGAVVQMVQLQMRAGSMQSLREQIVDSWRLGRWIVLGTFLGMINLQAIPWVITAFHGPADAANLAAVGNVLGLTNPIVLGLAGVLTPSVSAAHAKDGSSAAVRVGLRYALMGAALLLPVWLLIAIFPTWVLEIFYRHQDSPFRALSTALRWMLLIYVIHYGGAMVGHVLGGLGRSGLSLISHIAAVLATLSITMPLAYRFSYMGSLWGGAASETFRLIVGQAVVQNLLRGGRALGQSTAAGGRRNSGL